MPVVTVMTTTILMMTTMKSTRMADYCTAIASAMKSIQWKANGNCTWIRNPKPIRLFHDVQAEIGGCFAPPGGWVTREDVGHRQDGTDGPSNRYRKDYLSQVLKRLPDKIKFDI